MSATELAQGDIIKRGDTGTLGVIISNDLVHRTSGWIIVCSVNLSQAGANMQPALVAIPGGGYAVPIKTFTIPASAVAEVAGQVTVEQLRKIIRINHAGTSV